MAMNFDTYNTSFQSLMNPMYNVNANYTLGGAYAGGAAGAGVYGAGGYMNPAMMNMYASGPMANVGIGQFKADYLIKGDDQNNNYYARPIAVHKKKDEVPTILGILGTALGTAALLTALAKGKKINLRKTPKPTPASTATPNPVVTQSGAQPYVAPKYINPLTKPSATGQLRSQLMHGLNQPYNPVNTQTTGVPTPYVAPKYIAAGTQPTAAGQARSQLMNGLNQPYNPVNTQTTGIPTPYVAPKYIAAGTQPTAAGQARSQLMNGLNQQAALPAPTSNIAGALPAPSNNIAGLLQAPTQSTKQQAALAKQAAALNLPTSGKVYTTPLTPAQATAAGVMTPEAQAAYNKVLGQQFKPGIIKDARRKDAAIAFSQMPNIEANSKLATANINAVRPDLASQGSVVYTTHTPESLANGYSIGSNAKGANKLAELLAKLQ